MLPIQSISQDEQIRMILFREYLRNSDPADVAEKINSQFGRRVTKHKRVKYFFNCFKEKEEAELFDKRLTLYKSLSLSEKEKYSVNSLLWIDKDEEKQKMWMLMKNERLMIFSCRDEEGKKWIEVYDLFRGMRRKTPTPSIYFSTKFLLTSNFLLAIGESYAQKNMQISHVYKIHPKSLIVTEIETEYFQLDMFTFSVLSNQLDKVRFLLKNKKEFKEGKIDEVGKISWGEKKTLDVNFDYGQRFWGSKLQGFLTDWEDPLKFLEVDLETGHRNSMRVPIEIEELRVGRRSVPSSFCWSDQSFYALYPTPFDEKHTLLMLNLETQHWTNIQIFSKKQPIDMFIEEKEEVLTLRIRNYNTLCAFYRIPLKRPETLEYLTRFAALRETCVYGNEEGAKIVRQLQF